MVGGEYRGACPDIELLEVVRERNALRVDRQVMDTGSIDVFESRNFQGSAVELMRRLLLSCDNNLNSLAKWEVCDYSRFKGIGPAKSITVMAALELGKRRKLQSIKERPQITCSKDIYDIFQPLMCDLEQIGRASCRERV